MKRITIKDIAGMLQISTSTVSRALSNHPDISEAVKARVREAAETFNYVPSDFAINFRKKSSKMIGLIIPKFSMFFVPSIVEGISAKLNKEGYNFFLLSSEENVETEKENLQICANSHVDGVMISVSNQTKDLEHFRKMDDLGIPVVIFDKSLPQKKYDQIVFDNTKDAENCALKLINHGCKNVLGIFGSENLEITNKRLKSFQEIMNKNPDIRYKTIFCDSAENVREKLDILLDYEDFDGIFAMSDETLAGLNYTLKMRGISGNLFKVVAISEGIFPKYLNPHFEFEKNDGFKMGMMAASVLLQKIKEKRNNESGMTYFV